MKAMNKYIAKIDNNLVRANIYMIDVFILMKT